jgi:hypothetical protein
MLWITLAKACCLNAESAAAAMAHCLNRRARIRDRRHVVKAPKPLQKLDCS